MGKEGVSGPRSCIGGCYSTSFRPTIISHLTCTLKPTLSPLQGLPLFLPPENCSSISSCDNCGFDLSLILKNIKVLFLPFNHTMSLKLSLLFLSILSLVSLQNRAWGSFMYWQFPGSVIPEEWGKRRLRLEDRKKKKKYQGGYHATQADTYVFREAM